LITLNEGIGGGGESYVKRQTIPDCGGKIAKGSFAEFSGESVPIQPF